MTDNFDSFTGPSNIEAFQFLKINIQNLMEDKSLKTILVTSALPAEGKSFTVANLAVAMAYSGKRVIIVDFNLRQPQQHNYFDLLNDTGLMNVLAGEAETSRVLKDTEIYNLKVFTGGQMSNPSKYLVLDKIKQILNELKDMADLVLIDSPPVLAVADAAAISGLMDGVLIMVRGAKAEVDNLIKVKETLEKVKANLIGVVLYTLDSEPKLLNKKKPKKLALQKTHN